MSMEDVESLKIQGVGEGTKKKIKEIVTAFLIIDYLIKTIFFEEYNKLLK